MVRERDRPKALRCAIYTRKSSEEGLEQEFNSLHAQREACEAYIRSQVHEGWKPVPTAYDDGGYSGGTMERPGLKLLLADVHGRRVDVVVVYKVDRLTRALNDFARIVDVFDAHSVSFVSVTQQFNTTTSMGRLTLNVLLSFAQFEREVTGERIRDKIAASKKKGMWMGGVVPLGYDARDRTLAINETDAAIVREIFGRYLEHGTVNRLQIELDRRGIKTKRYVTASGRMIGDRSFSRGHLYRLLANPVYLGEIRHREIRHPGLHPAIIDRDTWDAVQSRLASNARERREGTTARHPSILAGLMFDGEGNRFVATHATKNGKRYRYYTCAAEPDGAAGGDAATAARLPAGEIEPFVISAITTALRDEKTVLDGTGAIGLQPSILKTLFAAAARLADVLAGNAFAGQRAALLELVQRIEIGRDAVEIRLRSQMLLEHLPQAVQTGANDDSFVIKRPLHFVPTGGERTLVIEVPEGERDAATPASRADLKGVARGFVWFEELASGRARSAREIAKREAVTDRYVSRLIDRALDFAAASCSATVLEPEQPFRMPLPA